MPPFHRTLHGMVVSSAEGQLQKQSYENPKYRSFASLFGMEVICVEIEKEESKGKKGRWGDDVIPRTGVFLDCMPLAGLQSPTSS